MRIIPMNQDRDDRYIVKSIVHCHQVLMAFQSSGEALSLRDVSARSGLPKTMTFRVLYTLEKCGLVDKISSNLYRARFSPLKKRTCRLGYAAQGTDYQFSKEVSASI